MELMKKFILITLGLMFITLGTFAQPMATRYMPDLSEYTNVKSYPLERHYFYSENLLEGENLISLGGGYYMAKMDNIPDFVVNFNADSTKAVILGAPYHVDEFIVKFNESGTRLTLYHEKPYFGFVYDSKYKVLYFFNSRKYHKKVRKFIKMHPVL